MPHRITRQIIDLLGGHTFLFAIGAHEHNSIANEGIFHFRFRGCPKANLCHIRLDLDNVYTMKFFKAQSSKYYLIDRFDNLYPDEIRSTFECFTGLVVGLPEDDRQVQYA